MSIERSFVDLNRAATDRMRALAARLPDEEMQHPVGEQLPLWAAIPPRQAARLAIETAETLDRRLEAYPPDLLELIHAEYKRYVFRAYHRTEHLNEAEAALRSDSSPADNPPAARARSSE